MREAFHPDFEPYARIVSDNCVSDFVVICATDKANRTKWFTRAAGRLESIGWFTARTTYRGNHVLYVTRYAYRLPWAKVFVGIAAVGDGTVYGANLYQSDGLGYSGTGWYGRVMYPLPDTTTLIPCTPHRAVVWPNMRLTAKWAAQAFSERSESIPVVPSESGKRRSVYGPRAIPVFDSGPITVSRVHPANVDTAVHRTIRPVFCYPR